MKLPVPRIQIPPCRPYEIPIAEAWLCRMAEHGLHLEKDGFAFGLAFFERGDAQTVRYRFDTAKSAALFEDGGVEADRAALYAASGWDYVAQWSDFCIFRCTDADAAELHTDPDIHAAALKKVKRGALWGLLWMLVLVILWGGLMICNTSLLRAVLGMGLIHELCSAAIILLGLYLSAEQFFILHAYYKKLKSGTEPAVSPSAWQKRSVRRRLSFVLSLVLIFAWIGSGAAALIASVDEERILPLEGNETQLPFALMQDLYPDAAFTYASLSWTNEIEVRSDLGIPVHLYVLQNGTITLPDGTIYDGGLSVRCIETVSPAFTELLARQYRESDADHRHFNGYEPLPESVSALTEVQTGALQIDLYCTDFRTVLLVYENRLLHVTFYSINDAISAEAVILAMAESITG